MTKPSEKIATRRIVLPDGRYLIFYTFAPSAVAAPSEPALDEAEGIQETPSEET